MLFHHSAINRSRLQGSRHSMRSIHSYAPGVEGHHCWHEASKVLTQRRKQGQVLETSQGCRQPEDVPTQFDLCLLHSSATYSLQPHDFGLLQSVMLSSRPEQSAQPRLSNMMSCRPSMTTIKVYQAIMSEWTRDNGPGTRICHGTQRKQGRQLSSRGKICRDGERNESHLVRRVNVDSLSLQNLLNFVVVTARSCVQESTDLLAHKNV